MLDLGKIRDEIDATDDEIVRLFQHRMALTAEVAQYKIETGKAVFDAERERQKLEKLTGEGTNAFNIKGIQELFQQIMSISRKRQYQLLTENGGEEMTDYTQVDHLPTHGKRVVFQGVEGAYSFGAMKEFFDDYKLSRRYLERGDGGDYEGRSRLCRASDRELHSRHCIRYL